MIKNFLITVYRNIIRSKFYSALNIIGLSIGLVCAIFIMLYIRDEISFDQHHENHECIIRLGSDFTINGKRDRVAVSALPIGPTLKRELPEVVDYVRFESASQMQFKYGENVFFQNDVAFVDSSLFNIFTYQFVKGDPSRALSQANTVVLNESVVRKIFGDEDPIGKVLVDGDDNSYTVTGVVKDQPLNSHIRFDVLISMKTQELLAGSEIFNSTEPLAFWQMNVYTFLLLDEHCKPDEFASKFAVFYDTHMKPFAQQLDVEFHPVIHSLDQIHLHSDLMWDLPTGNIRYIYVLLIVGSFILLIASINYMNMATARSVKRAKEVGVRKVVGASKGHIVCQFLAESMLMAFLALLIALAIVQLSLPVFNMLVNKELVFGVKQTPDMICLLLGLATILGVLSGSYPAFFLSRFSPVGVFVRKPLSVSGVSGLRKFLVVFQFTIASVMISGTLIVVSQLFYVDNTFLGFEKENVLVVPIRDSLIQNRMCALKDELKKNSNVRKVATSFQEIGFMAAKQLHMYQGESGMEQYALNFLVVDYDFIDLMEMEVVAGRAFSPSFATDTSRAFIVNQSAVTRFGWGSNAIGKKLQVGAESSASDDNPVRRGEVIGVLKDFHYEPLKDLIEPLSIVVQEDPEVRRFMYIKINAFEQQKTIDYIRKVWNEFSPNAGLDYKFMEDHLSESYDSEKRLSHIFIGFSLLSILIASMGLFGLSSFMAEQRTKELGIRKVLGAQVGSLVTILVGEFFRLVIVANILSIPIAYWCMSRWLDDFAYHTTIKIWIFLVTLIISLFIALCTVAWQSYKAAKGNVVVALKYQ